MSEYPIEHLSSGASWQVVCDCRIGRIGGDFASGPDIFPVSYVVFADAIYIKTGPESRLRRETEGVRVAFEATVDNPDGFSSAVCWGTVCVVDDPALSAALDDLPIVQFAATAEAVWLELHPEAIRGRRLHMLAP